MLNVQPRNGKGTGEVYLWVGWSCHVNDADTRFYREITPFGFHFGDSRF